LDRQTRKDLKTDKFAEDVFDVMSWATEHKAAVIRYSVAVVAVVAIGLGIMFYNRSQATQREEALAKALRIDDAIPGPVATPPALHFNTEEEKDKARTAAFSELASKYSGSQEAAMAEMYMAGYDVDAGNLDSAAKRFKHVVDDAPKPYAALARLALAQVYATQGKTADAEKLLRELINNPTVTVSKEQATLVLGQLLAQSNPAEAHKLIDPLRTSTRSAVSRAAITASAAIPNAAAK
jgi:predicted negative regulator of RcsB-dependent stress response